MGADTPRTHTIKDFVQIVKEVEYEISAVRRYFCTGVRYCTTAHPQILGVIPPRKSRYLCLDQKEEGAVYQLPHSPH